MTLVRIRPYNGCPRRCWAVLRHSKPVTPGDVVEGERLVAEKMVDTRANGSAMSGSVFIQPVLGDVHVVTNRID